MAQSPLNGFPYSDSVGYGQRLHESRERIYIAWFFLVHLC